MKPIIAVDIDDVLLPHFQDLINWYNRTYGTKVTLADNNGTDPRPWGTDTDEEAIRRVHHYFETAEFRDALPFTEAKEVLFRLSGHYRLIVISARDSLIEEMTRDWLKRHFSELVHDAHFTARYSLEGKKREKGDVCREVGAAYLIDDSLDNALSAAAAGVDTLLFGTYPWNEAATLPPKVIRCADWPAVEEYFDAQRG